MNSLKCPKSKSLSYCLTELFPFYQNKYWTIQRRDDLSVDPSVHRIIFKIVGFVVFVKFLHWVNVQRTYSRGLCCWLAEGLNVRVLEGRGSKTAPKRFLTHSGQVDWYSLTVHTASQTIVNCKLKWYAIFAISKRYLSSCSINERNQKQAITRHFQFSDHFCSKLITWSICFLIE